MYPRTQYIVTVTRTGHNGLTVRWFADPDARVGQELISATANGIRVPAVLDDAELVKLAYRVVRILASTPEPAAIYEMATHERDAALRLKPLRTSV